MGRRTRRSKALPSGLFATHRLDAVELSTRAHERERRAMSGLVPGPGVVGRMPHGTTRNATTVPRLIQLTFLKFRLIFLSSFIRICSLTPLS